MFMRRGYVAADSIASPAGAASAGRRCLGPVDAIGFGIVIVVCLGAGCSSGRKSVPMAPVTGVVTLDGKPVPDAVVTLKPSKELQATGAREAYGYTDGEGRFAMVTDGKKGAAVGKLSVFVGSNDANKPLGGTPTKANAKDPKPKTSEVTVAAGSNDLTIELGR
jgi:hypothetical protein